MPRTLCTAQRARVALAIAALAAAPAALAHHGGEGAVGEGDAIRLFSGDVMPMGRFGASLSYVGTFFRPLSSRTIEAGAEAGRSVHSIDALHDVIANVSVGLTERITITALVPWTYQTRFREGSLDDGGQASVATTPHIEGLGDLRVLVRVQVWSEIVRVTPIVGLRVPIGEEHRHAGDGAELEPDHEPSPGAFDPIFGLGATVPIGPVSVFASVLLDWTQPGRERFVASRTLSGGVGASGTIALSDALAVSPVLELLFEEESAQRLDDTPDRDTGGFTLSVAPGASVTIAKTVSVAVSIQVPVHQHHQGTQSDQRVGVLVAAGVVF